MVEKPAIVGENFLQNAPLVYHYGHKTPGHNPALYNRLVSRMADVIRERLKVNRKSEVSGVVINTCGWVKGEGYNQIKHIAQAFEVNAYRDFVIRADIRMDGRTDTTFENNYYHLFSWGLLGQKLLLI